MRRRGHSTENGWNDSLNARLSKFEVLRHPTPDNGPPAQDRHVVIDHTMRDWAYFQGLPPVADAYSVGGSRRYNLRLE